MKQTAKHERNITQDNDISKKFLWLSQIMEGFDTEGSFMCNPLIDASCSQKNFSSLGPNLTILNGTSNAFDMDSMGPRQDPYAIPMTVVYLILLITGVIGNVCTCIVIARNRYMHTATNYYLFSLAVSDLLLLVLGLPQDLHHLWSKFPYAFGEAFCILRGWSSETSTNASILTITAFTVERYLAICHPIRAHTMSRLSRAIKFIIVIWILSASAAITMGYQLGIIYEVDYAGHEILETATCTVKRPLAHAFEWSTFIFFFFPATILCILYALIGLQLRRSTDIGRKHDGSTQKINTNGTAKSQGKVLNEHGRPVARKTSASSSRKDVIKMLGMCCLQFFLLYSCQLGCYLRYKSKLITKLFHKKNAFYVFLRFSNVQEMHRLILYPAVRCFAQF